MNKLNKRICLISMTILITVASFFVGCNLQEYGLEEAFYRVMSVENRATTLEVLDKIDTSSTPIYDVLVITDIHYGNENKGKNGPRREKEWFKQLDKVQANGKKISDNVKFAICLGDVADHGKKEEFKKFDEEIRVPLEKIKTSMAPNGIKLYNIIGNHDLYNSGWNSWSSILYPHTSFYKFETSKFSWYFIDSASGTIGGYQYDALTSALKKDSKPKMMFSHVPIYADDFLYFTMQNTEERNLLISKCVQSNLKWFVDGHTHKDRTSDFGTFTEKNVPGFLEKYGYAIMHVNETTGKISIDVKYY